MSRHIISENLQAAIERLRPELPELLGADYTNFVAQLDALLAGGSESQVWDLFKKYPVVHERLEEVQSTTRGGLGGLGGDPQPYRRPFYRCEVGAHVVAAREVQKRDAAFNALCPKHGVPMIKIDEKGIKPSQEQG
jgi:hypothetical protein